MKLLTAPALTADRLLVERPSSSGPPGSSFGSLLLETAPLGHVGAGGINAVFPKHESRIHDLFMSFGRGYPFAFRWELRVAGILSSFAVKNTQNAL